jgi:hypothetical protein
MDELSTITRFENDNAVRINIFFSIPPRFEACFSTPKPPCCQLSHVDALTAVNIYQSLFLI